jgi:allophanate hydrolase subunit 1
MATHNPALDDPSAASASLATLAEQLRDGPIQELMELQHQATELAVRLADSPADQLEDLERLVRLSLSAMQHFHAFTREFGAVVRELADTNRPSH